MLASLGIAAVTFQTWYIDPETLHHYRVFDPTAPGVVVDKQGPPERANFKLTFLFYAGGLPSPISDTVSYGGFQPYVFPSDLLCWPRQGFAVRKDGPTRLRFVGYKSGNLLLPVTRIKVYSDDLPPSQWFKVVEPPKQAG